MPSRAVQFVQDDGIAAGQSGAVPCISRAKGYDLVRCRAGDVADPVGAERDVLQGAPALLELRGSALAESCDVPQEGVEHAGVGVKRLFGLAFWASDGDEDADARAGVALVRQVGRPSAAAL